MYSVLRPLQKLQYLLLSENQLEVIDDGDLNVLPSLKELSLDHNKISQVQIKIFNKINFLFFLDWSECFKRFKFDKTLFKS